MEQLKTRPTVDLKAALFRLEDTACALASAVAGLTEEEGRRKPEPDVWSVSEIAEHLATVEGLFLKNVAVRLAEAPPPDAGFDTDQTDAQVLAAGRRDRYANIKAPDRAAPTGSATLAENLETFRGRREQTIAFFQGQPDLREHAVAHPLFGLLDGYQWALLMASHTERHIGQIEDLKAQSK